MGELKLIEAEDLLELSNEYLSNAISNLGDDEINRAGLACGLSIAAALQSISKQLEDVNNGLGNIAAVIEAS